MAFCQYGILSSMMFSFQLGPVTRAAFKDEPTFPFAIEAAGLASRHGEGAEGGGGVSGGCQPASQRRYERGAFSKFAVAINISIAGWPFKQLQRNPKHAKQELCHGEAPRK